MKKLFLSLAACAVIACQSNPYEGIGPTKSKKDVNPAPKPQGVFQLIGDVQVTGVEGAELVQKFEIKDDANPTGPFRIYLTGFPDGTTLKAVSNTLFEIHYMPTATFTRGRAAQIVEAQVHVIDPDNKILDGMTTWTINNNPLTPYVLSPTIVDAKALSTLNFTVLAEDLNGEEFTHFTILSPSNQPGLVGRETLLNTDPKNIYQTTEFDVSWSNIPAALSGQTVTITIQACVNTYQKCTTRDIQVNIAAQ